MGARTPVSGATAPRPRLVEHPWRVAIVFVTLIAVASLGAWAYSESDTESAAHHGLPSTIDATTPGNGELIRPEDTIGVDLRDDLTGVLLVTGPTVRGEIPEDQLERVGPLGQITFRPGPQRDVAKWGPGTYQATVLYWSQGKARPAHPNAFTWTFRVGA